MMALGDSGQLLDKCPLSKSKMTWGVVYRWDGYHYIGTKAIISHEEK